MAVRVVRLVCITLMSLWLTGKIIVFSPLLAIPLIGATIVYMINEISEIKEAKNENKKKQKHVARHKKVTKKQS